MEELKNIPIASIRENPVALRSVNRTSEEYLGLVDSIRQKGVLNPILVREIASSNGEKLYGLIDGLHRFTAATDAGLETIPAHVRAMNDADVLEAQLIANIHKIETRPVEYSKQLIRILAGNPLLTTSELATKLAKSPAWLGERLGLVKLVKSVADLVDENKINLSNAYALAKLPEEEQINFVDRALTMSPQEFIPTVNARVKEIKDAKRQGRDASKDTFTPVPHLQKVGDLKTEMETGAIGQALHHKLAPNAPKAWQDGFAMGVKWALHMDPESVKVAEEKDKARKAELAAQKEKNAKERTEKKLQEAAQKRAKLEEDARKLGIDPNSIKALSPEELAAKNAEEEAKKTEVKASEAKKPTPVKA